METVVHEKAETRLNRGNSSLDKPVFALAPGACRDHTLNKMKESSSRGRPFLLPRY